MSSTRLAMEGLAKFVSKSFDKKRAEEASDRDSPDVTTVEQRDRRSPSMERQKDKDFLVESSLIIAKTIKDNNKRTPSPLPLTTSTPTGSQQHDENKRKLQIHKGESLSEDSRTMY